MDDGRVADDDNDSSHERGERPGIQSAEVAAAILRAMAEGGGAMRLSALAAATGLHRGKVHRYLVSLARTGLVVQDDKAGSYAIGPLAVTVGLVGLRRLDPVRLAYDALPGLRDRVNETVVLAIWGDMGATVIALEESAQMVTLNVRVGSTLPLLASATGRVFAAFLPPAVTKPFLAAERAKTKAARAQAAPSDADYARVLDKVRATPRLRRRHAAPRAQRACGAGLRLSRQAHVCRRPGRPPRHARHGRGRSGRDRAQGDGGRAVGAARLRRAEKRRELEGREP
jgi:DNA-binding IclR family transcriptional regulator